MGEAVPHGLLGGELVGGEVLDDLLLELDRTVGAAGAGASGRRRRRRIHALAQVVDHALDGHKLLHLDAGHYPQSTPLTETGRSPGMVTIKFWSELPSFKEYFKQDLFVSLLIILDVSHSHQKRAF